MNETFHGHSRLIRANYVFPFLSHHFSPRFLFFYLSQLALEARALKLSPLTMIKVANVGFFDCYVGYFPFHPSGKHSLWHLRDIV